MLFNAHLAAAKPKLSGRINPGLITSRLFNRLWAKATAGFIVEPGIIRPYNHARGNLAVLNGNPTLAWQHELGQCIDLDGTDDCIHFNDNINDYTAGVTIMMLAEFDAVDVYVASASDTTLGNTIVNTTSNFRINNDGVATASFGVPVITGTPIFLAVSSGNGVAHVITRRLDTGAVASATGAWTHSGANRSGATFGARGNNAFSQDGRIAAGYVGAVYLTLAELIEWSKDPWALWREDEEEVSTYIISVGGPSEQNVTPSGIANTNAFGSPQLDLNILADGFGHVNAFGTPIVTLGSEQTLIVNGIASVNAFGSPQLDLNVSPNGVAHGNLFGTPQLDLNILANGIASVVAFGSPIVANAAGGTQTLIPVGIASTNAFGSPQLDLNVLVNGLASALTFGTPAVSSSILSVFPVGIVADNKFGNPTITLEEFVTSVGPLTFDLSKIEIDPLMPTPVVLLEREGSDNSNTLLRDQLSRVKRNIYRDGTVAYYLGNIYLAADTNENQFISFTIPKGFLDVKGKSIILRLKGVTGANTNNKRWRLYWNSIEIFDSADLAHNNLAWDLNCEIVCESTSRQIIITTLSVNGANPIIQYKYATEDALSDISLSVTGQSNVGSLGDIKAVLADLQYKDRQFDA